MSMSMGGRLLLIFTGVFWIKHIGHMPAIMPCVVHPLA